MKFQGVTHLVDIVEEVDLFAWLRPLFAELRVCFEPGLHFEYPNPLYLFFESELYHGDPDNLSLQWSQWIILLPRALRHHSTSSWGIKKHQICSYATSSLFGHLRNKALNLSYVSQRGSLDFWEKVAMTDFALMNLDGGKNLAMNFFHHLFPSVEAFVWMWLEPCFCLTCQGEWESSEVDSFSIFVKSSHGTAKFHEGRQMCAWIFMIHSSKGVWAYQTEQCWLKFHKLVAERRNDYVVVMFWSLLISIVAKSPPWWFISFSFSISHVIFYKWLLVYFCSYSSFQFW